MSEPHNRVSAEDLDEAAAAGVSEALREQGDALHQFLSPLFGRTGRIVGGLVAWTPLDRPQSGSQSAPDAAPDQE